jgi:hypothetical protein
MVDPTVVPRKVRLLQPAPDFDFSVVLLEVMTDYPHFQWRLSDAETAHRCM